MQYAEDLELEVRDLRRDLLYAARLDSLERTHLVRLHELELRALDDERPGLLERVISNPVVVFVAGYVTAAWVTREVLD